MALDAVDDVGGEEEAGEPDEDPEAAAGGRG